MRRTAMSSLADNIFCWWALCVRHDGKRLASQCSLHNAPIFRLLLKVAVNGTHQCESLNFCGTSRPNTPPPLNSVNSCQHNGTSLSASVSSQIHSGYAIWAWVYASSASPRLHFLLPSTWVHTVISPNFLRLYLYRISATVIL